MAAVMHAILLLSGLCYLSSCVLQPKFVLFQIPKTWFEAQSYCRDKCFDLATINDMSEMETVLKSVDGKYDDALWIGIRKGSTLRWHWSLAEKDFYKEGERNYLQWGSVNGHSCGAFKNGKLRVASCIYARYSVCFDGTKQGEDQYILTEKKMIWIVAREYCRTHYTDLASARNDAEYQIIQEVSNGVKVWVGLSRDLWEWADKSDSSLRYWEANQDVSTSSVKVCGALLKEKSGRWGEVKCVETHPFLCDCRNKLSFITVKITVQESALDLSDPSVQDSILEQIRQKLSENVTDVFHLHWKKNSHGRVFIKQPQRND